MSRTLKTIPFWTRLATDPKRLGVEMHNHSIGPCDLPVKPPIDIAAAPKTNCTWGPSQELLHGKDHGDGCPVCTNHDGRRIDRRRSRHTARIRSHALALQSAHDIDD
jgi:hypothetical protein